MHNTRLTTKVKAELGIADAADAAVIESLPEERRESARERLLKIREKQRANINDAPPPTIAAASFGDPLLLSELVRHYDPRLADADGRTALMDAAWSCRFSAEDRPEESLSIQCLKILLPLSDPTAQTSTGLTALMCAGSAQAATILLPVSEPKVTDERGRTALMHAVQGNRPRVVEALLSSSNVNAVSEAGATALDFALGYADHRVKIKLVELLAPLTIAGIDRSLAIALDAAAGTSEKALEMRPVWRGVVDVLASRATREAAKAAMDKFRSIDFPETSLRLSKRSSG
jgi:ankyrin repeat protein